MIQPSLHINTKTESVFIH